MPCAIQPFEVVERSVKAIQRPATQRYHSVFETQVFFITNVTIFSVLAEIKI